MIALPSLDADMQLPAVVDAADQLHMAARAAVRALTAVVEDIDAGWGGCRDDAY